MKHSRMGIAGRCGWLKLVVTLAVADFGSASAVTEQTFPLFQTKTATYTNVTITSKSADYVFVVHSGGMASVRVQDLPPETKHALGYAAPEEKHSRPGAAIAKDIMPKLLARLQPIEEKLRSYVPWTREQLHPSRNVIYGLGGVAATLYLFFSYCCHLICIKSKKAPSALVWFPILKWIPLLRAAEMSRWWLLILWLPIVPIVWAFKIAKARGMSAWVSIFLILPGTSPFAFLYLAFSRESPSQNGPKYKSMALQSA